MYTEEQKKEIEWLEVLKGACCTSNNLQMKLAKMPKNGNPVDRYAIKLLLNDFQECLNRIKTLITIPEMDKVYQNLEAFILAFSDTIYGEMYMIAHDVHIAIDREYYKHYSDKMGIVENPRK